MECVTNTLRQFATLLLGLALVGCSSPTPQPLITPPSSRTPSASTSSSPTPPPPPPVKDHWIVDELVPGLQPAKGAFVAPRPSAAKAGPPLKITLPAHPGNTQWRTSNVGLSFESTDLVDPRWDPARSPLTPLLASLNGPSLRFGGNSVDRRVFWTSKKEAKPRWATVTVTPADLQRLARMANEVDATVTLVLDLGHYDPKRAADMAFHASKALGPRLKAVSIGNEPNGYNLASQPKLKLRDATWSPAAYVRQANAYVKAIHARTPKLAIAGPGAYDTPWWRAFGTANFPHTAAMSQHWYPLWSCADRKGTKEPHSTPTIANMTSPWLHTKADKILGMGRATAKSYGLPLWLEEAGPTSCPGATVSRTHAHALWNVDFTLNAADNGVQRTNMHSTLLPCGRGNPMSVVCSTTQSNGPDPVIGQSTFQSLIFAAQVTTGRITQVETGDSRVTGYLVTGARSRDLVLVNMHDPAKTGASPLKLTLPAKVKPRMASILTADSLAATNKTTLKRLAPVAANQLTTLDAGSAVLIRLA